MPKANKKRTLISAALQARQHAVAPYSNFQVGAALLTTAGNIITGANVESASYGLTCCAERVALFKALTQSENAFAAIAIVAPINRGPTPCGACRQLLAEYAPRAVVWIADSRNPARIRQFSVAQLLPKAFVLAHARTARAVPPSKSR
jgi:cytidine deaminase